MIEQPSTAHNVEQNRAIGLVEHLANGMYTWRRKIHAILQSLQHQRQQMVQMHMLGCGQQHCHRQWRLLVAYASSATQERVAMVDNESVWFRRLLDMQLLPIPPIDPLTPLVARRHWALENLYWCEVLYIKYRQQ
jgi:hypothetical protein